MRKKFLNISIIGALSLLVLIAAFFILVWNGMILLNGFSAERYDIKGIDVSSYQGEIDWEVLSSQNISFVFIKATEGSSFVDKNFDSNFSGAQKTSLAVGAYHFFSYDSSGQTQAENFINTVTPFEGMLPPVIDLEFYGDKEKNPPDRESVELQLKTMLSVLEAHYGQKPIIYATETSYELYLSNDYEEYDIWIRNVITKPELTDNRAWVFWQYSNRGKLDGYNGKEKYIDLNVFNGSAEEYTSYLQNRTYKNLADEGSNP
jgi:lysozyme